MEIRRIKPDAEVINALLPPGLTEITDEDGLETLFLGGFEKEEPVCLGLFSRRLDERSCDIHLEYITTVPDSRDAGKCREFIEGCRVYFRELPVRNILVKYCINPASATGFNNLMRGCGLKPLSLTGRLLHYNSKDLKRRGAIQMIINNRDKLPPVVSFEKAGEEKITSYLNKHGLPVFPFAVNRDFSYVYMSGDDVDAAIVATAPGGKTLFISALYMDDIAKQKNMFLSLFSECFNAAATELNEDFDVCFQVADESIAQNLFTVFNPPDEEYMCLEYMLRTEPYQSGSSQDGKPVRTEQGSRREIPVSRTGGHDFLISSVRKELNIPEKRKGDAPPSLLSSLPGPDAGEGTGRQEFLFSKDMDSGTLSLKDISLAGEETAETEFNREGLKNPGLRQRFGHSLMSEKARRMKAYIESSESPDPGDIARFIADEEKALNIAANDHISRKSGDESALRAAYLLEEFQKKKELLLADKDMAPEERAKRLYDFSKGFADDIDRFITLYLDGMKDRHRKKKIGVYIDRYRKLMAYFEDKAAGKTPDDAVIKEMGL